MARSIAAVASATLLLASPCNARSWFVTLDGTGDAPTIQAAADSSSPGDTVLVAPGTYVEQVHLTAPVTLSGAGSTAATTIHAGTGKPGYCVSGPSVLGGSVVFENLRFEGATFSGYGYGGYAVSTGGTTMIRDCIFENSEGAVAVTGDLTLLGSTVRHSGGVFFSGSSLVVEECLFEEVEGWPAIVEIHWLGYGGPTVARVTENTFRNNGDLSGGAMIGYDIAYGALDLLVSSNLFVSNGGPAVAFAPLPVTSPRQGRGGTVAIEIRENTIARHPGYTVGWDSPAFGKWLEETIALERNSITGCGSGPYFETPLPALTLECNDVWANGVNWTGIPDPTGSSGNISLEPKYCGAEHGDFTVATNSPLRPTNNSCHVQIGAFGVGCGPISVESASWGRIKTLYRNGR